MNTKSVARNGTRTAKKCRKMSGKLKTEDNKESKDWIFRVSTELTKCTEWIREDLNFDSANCVHSVSVLFSGLPAFLSSTGNFASPRFVID
jgi:hypothetical protein